MMQFNELEGERVKLIPLVADHLTELYACSKHPEIWLNYPLQIASMEDMSLFIEGALKGRERGEQFPYVVYDKQLQRIIGSTRYLRISEENRNLNIGSTWLIPHVWRTSVNTEAKYLMLRYAFETLQVVRVEIITTPDNERSQRAIERLGAVREGLFRQKYNRTDYIVYSIIDSEWDRVKQSLNDRLGLAI
ncbi:GNAT family N-acetyltransferase [Paenibacillus oenotherae]|uniref:GNAT family N-acetyltransferase n=1 Tax=Paenibacillus oenotherae TaxID=1435645 RepID=A0ABS7DC93_9BACL|nr:GNAT family N-acetyltransferase [Paenibacillus oenotherae]MBW7477562.1 GNAT family N-acetyltransferase [Paenibacillus oenotherae]